MIRELILVSCYYPSSSRRTEQVYPVSSVRLNRVPVEVVGRGNLLYTAQSINRSRTIPTYHPLETFLLPNDYPCRLSPVAQILEPTPSSSPTSLVSASEKGAN